VVGVLTSVASLNEELGPTTLIGGAIVLVGLWLVEHGGAASTPATQPTPAPSRA
jgi:drug/metabolite transporter (DMT)-like permease